MVLLAGQGDPTSSVDSPSLTERLRSVLVTGAAITIPLLITLVVLSFVVNFVLQTISPVVLVVERALGVGQNRSDVVLEVLAVATIVVLVFVVGVVAETRSGSGLERAFDTAMARIPGVGSVYTSFNEMSELLLSNDTQSFRDVKLVEFPSAGMYTVAFVTADTPGAFREATDNEEMTTLFMPLAPNPVMGGFVLHVAEDRVHDVDLTVEEGIRSIVTSGVATGEADDALADGELVDLDAIRRQARDGVEDIGDWGAQTADDIADISAVTVEELEELGEQTRRELVSVYPGAESSEDDAERSPRHYMLTRADDVEGDGRDGADDAHPTDDNPGRTDETSATDTDQTGGEP